jgi:hypothetical protein
MSENLIIVKNSFTSITIAITRIYFTSQIRLLKSFALIKVAEKLAETFVYGERLRTSVGYLRARFHCGRNIATWAQTRNSNE